MILEIDIQNSVVLHTYLRAKLPRIGWKVDANTKVGNMYWIDFKNQTARFFNLNFELRELTWAKGDDATTGNEQVLETLEEIDELIEFIQLNQDTLREVPVQPQLSEYQQEIASQWDAEYQPMFIIPKEPIDMSKYAHVLENLKAISKEMGVPILTATQAAHKSKHNLPYYHPDSPYYDPYKEQYLSPMGGSSKAYAEYMMHLKSTIWEQQQKMFEKTQKSLMTTWPSTFKLSVGQDS